jgi:putative cell wall-binding protein
MVGAGDADQPCDGPGVGRFSGGDPQKIAASIKRSAQVSKRRKASPYRSALSMITFYFNRAGKKLSTRKKAVLQRAKVELRHQFDRE